MNDTIELARMVAPEDLRAGDCIAVLNAAQEYVPYGGCEDFQAKPEVHVVWMCGDGHPLRIEAVCLPFVLVSSPSGEHSTLDVRRSSLVRLSDRYATEAFKRLNKSSAASDDNCMP